MTREEIIASVAKEMGFRRSSNGRWFQCSFVSVNSDATALVPQACDDGPYEITVAEARAALAFIDECERRLKEAGL